MIRLNEKFPFTMRARAFSAPVFALAAIILPLLFGRQAFAQETATWLASPPDNQWNASDGSEWSTGVAPNNEGDTAVFATSASNAIIIPAAIGNTSVPNGPAMVFNPGASAYTFTVTDTGELVIGGAGITNNSSNAQDFLLNSDSGGNGEIFFSGTATAGTNTGFNLTGGSASIPTGADIEFYNTSSGGHGAFTVQGGSAAGADGATINFNDSSTGGNGSFTIDGGSATGALGGSVSFDTSATAGSGTFVVNGETADDAFGGTLTFASTSAGNGTFTVYGGAGAGTPTAPGEGLIDFTGTATAANGKFTDYGGSTNSTAYGGYIIFQDNSTAGNATFTTYGPTDNSGADPATIYFDDSTSAGSGHFTNVGGHEAFESTSSADNGVFIEDGGTSSTSTVGAVEFFGNSTAGNGKFTNNAGTVSGAYGGEVLLFGTSSAGNGTFTNNGGAVSGAMGGSVQFAQESTANGVTIINNGGTVSGAMGGTTSFGDNSTAGSATLIARGGVGTGSGAEISFSSSATGGTSRVEIFDNSHLDISELTVPSLTIGSIEGGGTVYLGSFNLTVGSNNLSTTYSGAMVDGDGGFIIAHGGSFTKIGTGTLTFTGNNTYTGETEIEQGALQIDGSIASGPTLVDPNGTLGGSGIIGGNVANGGVVNPSGLSILGNYSQSSAGTLTIQIAGIGAGQHGLLAVSGSASLEGTLQLVRRNNFAPTAGSSITIVTAAKGVSGTFSTLDTNTILGAKVVYQPDDVLVDFTQGSYSAFAAYAGLTPNQDSVAHMLDKAATDTRASKLITALNNQPLQNLPGDFDLIAPEELTALYQINFSAAGVQQSNLEDRMQDIRDGSTGFVSKLSLSDSRGAVVIGNDGQSRIDTNQRDAFQPSPDNRWGVFVSGNGDFVNVDGDFNSRGYNFTTGGITLGLDYRANENLAFGVALDYAHTWTDLAYGGSIDADSTRLGFFATWFQDGFFVNGYLGGGYNNYDTSRAALDGLATGSTDAGEFDSFLTTGYDFHQDAWTFGPFASLAWTYVGIDNYTEAGSRAPLNIVSQNQDSLTTSLGWQVSYEGHVKQVAVTSQFKAGWQHQYAYGALPFDAQLASGAGGVFTVHGPSEGRDTAVVEAAVRVVWSPRVSVFLSYDGVVGDAYQSQSVTSGVEISF
jgi:autotransporter-associated beta strand protein